MFWKRFVQDLRLIRITMLESESTQGHTISQNSMGFLSFQVPQALKREALVPVGSLGGGLRILELLDLGSHADSATR